MPLPDKDELVRVVDDEQYSEAMPLDRASSTSPIFLARRFEDEVLLVAMDLLLDAYMQWFHIGSYRLAGLFSQ